MPGLVPGIHVLLPRRDKDVDRRDQPGPATTDRGSRCSQLQKNPRISLSFPAFGARTPPRPQPPHPWRPAAEWERAAMRPLTFRKQGLKQMASVKELKATARPAGGKGAARAERRAGRVPGVIYGNNQPPLTISVDDAELRQRILAGRFLTTIYDIDLEGNKHRVIPRDFQLDPVRDFPLHVDFMRLGEGATIRVSVPLHIVNAESAPGVKRGGTVNIVIHTIDLECSVDNIPQCVDADVSGLEISHSLHLSDITLPSGVKSLSREDVTLVTIVPPSGYAEEQKAAAAAAAAAGTAAAGAPAAAPGAAPAPGAAAPAAAAPAAPGAAPAAGAKA